MDLTGRSVIVTGAASGIGAATSARLAAAGAYVAVVDVAPAGEEVADRIRSDGGSADFYPADVTSDEQVESMVAAVVERTGRLDGAFNNAGVEQRNLALHELSRQQWEYAISVDLTGIFVCLKHEIRAMLGHGGGSIVNTASSLGKVAIPNASEYIAAKHGVIGLTLAAAVDYGLRGIRVNAVLPGITNTQMVARIAEDPRFKTYFGKLRERHAMGRFGETREIADAVTWLLSDSSSFVTGAAVPVDGGFLAG